MSVNSSSVSDTDSAWMQRALALADRAEQEGEVPVGALVVLDEELIGEGWNRMLAGNDPSSHAEINALRAAAARMRNYRLSGTTLYVTLEPCAMCAGAMVHARVDRLVFAASEPRAGVVSSNLGLLDQPWLNHRVTWSGGVLAEQSAQRLRAFFRARR